ncbi:hypothetical protein KKC_01337 [Listeria fleischmannii subsp. coloradonensis]|nr:hypothetical protein KKC_01337 [Listeria fleischmannii subsp. coloradonensis]STY35285.1 Uncharacterised protein [Listeria fleischmannii subsp. coloradonensis]
MNRARRFCRALDPTDSPQEQLYQTGLAIHDISSEYVKIKAIIMRRLERGQHINVDIIEYYNDLRWTRLNMLMTLNSLQSRIDKESAE